MMWVFFFFFKQKTAYEFSACLVGSEMCIRDSCHPQRYRQYRQGKQKEHKKGHYRGHNILGYCPFVVFWYEHPIRACLLYTSDAADEEDSVDLGGRRIIKKKKKENKKIPPATAAQQQRQYTPNNNDNWLTYH